MRRFVRKWFRALPWIALACAALCCAMAIYTWRFEADVYRSSAVLYAAPKQDTSFGVRMLVADCRAWTETEEFAQSIELSQNVSLKVSAEEQSHLIEITAEGTDAQLVFETANRAANAMQIALENVLQAQNTRVVQLPQLPQNPVGPDRMSRLLWTAVLGFVLASAMGGCLGNDPKKLRIQDRETASFRLAAVADTRRERVRYQKSKNRRSGTLLQHVNRLTQESARHSALTLCRMLSASNARVLALASVCPDDENAAAVTLVAGEIARQGSRVLLMELDGENAEMGTWLGVKAKADVHDYFQRKAELDEVIVQTEIAGLSFIDWLHPDLEAYSVVRTDAFFTFLTSVRERYDYVLLHAPALSEGAGAAMTALAADEVALLVPNGGAAASRVMGAAEMLHRLDKPALGVLFTGVKRWQLETEE